MSRLSNYELASLFSTVLQAFTIQGQYFLPTLGDKLMLPCLPWSTWDVQRWDEFWQAPFLKAKRFMIYSKDVSLSKCFFPVGTSMYLHVCSWRYKNRTFFLTDAYIWFFDSILKTFKRTWNLNSYILCIKNGNFLRQKCVC